MGRPVSHLSGEGWRGGFLAASIEQFLKLDLSKWLKVLRDLELLPRFMNQDWSWIWLQKFDGHVTILVSFAHDIMSFFFFFHMRLPAKLLAHSYLHTESETHSVSYFSSLFVPKPKSGVSDWLHLLADPDENRLLHCLTVGERQTFPKLHMIANRMKVEQMIARCRSEIKERLDKKTHGRHYRSSSGILSEDSENTVRARMNAFGTGHQSRDQKGNDYAVMGSEVGRKRSNRVASWPGLRYALGRELVGDYTSQRNGGNYRGDLRDDYDDEASQEDYEEEGEEEVEDDDEGIDEQ